MSFESITLINFQSWKKQKIKFHSGFNAIIGDSDSGKSAIQRGAYWVCENRPSGNDFVNWFAKENEKTLVKLQFENDFVIRKKVGNKNYYKTKDLTLEAFKTEVPEEIKDVLNMQEYNIQSQHKKYFLLQDSPGERAKILNKVVGLDTIDDVFGYLNSESLKINRTLKEVSASKKALFEKLKSYDDLEDIEVIVENLNIKTKFYERNSSTIEKSSELLEKLKKIKFENKTLKNWLQIEPEYTLLCQKIGTCDELAKTKQKTWATLQTAKEIRENMIYCHKKLKEEINQYTKILSENKICPVCKTSLRESVIKKIRESFL